MMENLHPHTRRAAIAAGVASTAALALPAVAKSEMFSEKINRLTEELSAALDELPEGQFRAIVEPSSHTGSRVWLQNRHQYPTLSVDGNLMALMKDWRAQYLIVNDSKGKDIEDKEMRRLWEIEDQVAKITPETAYGFAVKLLVMTNFGEFGLDGRAACVMADAERIYGKASPLKA